MKAIRTVLIFSLVVWSICGYCGAAHSEESRYPSKPIRIVVAHPAGGAFDMFYRMLSEELAKLWKVPVTVINQTKAMGAVAADTVANAKNDGYTLLGINIGILATMSAAKPDGPINLLRDYEPVLANIGFDSVLIAVNNNSKFRTLKDVINYAKEKPGELSCGTNTRGTEGYLQWELWKRVAKVNIKTLVLQGSKEILPQLLGGHIDLGTFAEATASPQMKAKKLRGLVIDTKSAKNPDIPTYTEAGYPEVNITFSCSILAPKGTPTAIMKSWEASLEAISKDQTFLAALTKSGINANFETNTKKIKDIFREEIEKRKQFSPDELGWK